MDKLCLRCGEPIPRPKSGIGGFASRKYHEYCSRLVRLERQRQDDARRRAEYRRINPPRVPKVRLLKVAPREPTRSERISEAQELLEQFRSVDPNSIYTRYAEARLEALS